MAGASKFAFLLSRRFKLCSRSLFPLSRNSYFTISAPRNEWKDSAMPNDQPRRWCSSVADERFQTQGRSSMPCDETHGSPVLPCSEWHKFVEYLTSRGYAGRVRVPPEGDEEEFSLDTDNMPEDFRKAAVACLRYAIEWPDLLRSLSRKEIEVLVENGSPFIFRKASDSVSRMKLFIYNQGNGVPTYEQARTIDLMRYLLSYVWNFLNSTGESNDGHQKLIESSVKTLLHELFNISSGIYGTDYIKSFGRNAYNEDYGAQRRPYQTIEMKKGDWLCPKCNFMNFARNAKCLECNETRPKVQPTNGDWECPQCNFFNYARNMKCLRCDCRRPEGIPPSKNPGFDQILNSSNVEKAEIERRLAENDEKAERWFSKISQLDSSSDLSSSIHDEDFPEIMPLRKGMNRFVLSTRKTPLERRMANMASQGTLSESTVSQTLDRILGTGAGKDSSFASVEKKIPNAVEQQDYGKQMPQGGAWNSRYDQSKDDARESSYRVENQHVAPPPYKRRIAVEQASNSNFIPFVPLPPDYFAKKENQLSQPSNSGQRESQPCQPLSSGQQDSQQSQHHNLGQHESLQGQPWSLGPRQSQHSQPSSFGQRESLRGQPWSFSQQESQQSQPLSFGQRESQQNQPSRWGQRDSPQSQSPSLVQQASKQNQSPSLDQQESQRASENFNYGFVGKSLEGSAVTEPDPLDMSEEAKAQRWFKRVSQIKDISELSNIPDEDFPEIMPLRKGVNRFVVSKRKTPLERRLTSPQYRRNLPIMTSFNSGKDSTGEQD